MRTAWTVTVGLTLVAFASLGIKDCGAMPVPKDRNPVKKVAPIPQVFGTWTFTGCTVDLAQTDRDFEITASEGTTHGWSGTGRINTGDLVVITWDRSGELGVGVYRIKDGKIQTGHWGYTNRVRVSENGELVDIGLDEDGAETRANVLNDEVVKIEPGVQ